jgi:hypothetical protein
MKVGDIVKIKTPLNFCHGVYNNAVAIVKIYHSDCKCCAVDLIEEKDKIRASRLGYVTKSVQVSVSYCQSKITKLSI